jgi:hypothetical protein
MASSDILNSSFKVKFPPDGGVQVEVYLGGLCLGFVNSNGQFVDNPELPAKSRSPLERPLPPPTQDEIEHLAAFIKGEILKELENPQSPLHRAGL